MSEHEATRATRHVTYDIAAKIRPAKVEWLLDNWVPKNEVTLLGGREGIGKSTIAVDWAAKATRGELTGAPMNVAYVVTEDSKEHTVVPRLIAAGADLRRVMFPKVRIPDPETGETFYGGLDLPGDYPILKQFIQQANVGLVILDAAKSVMSSKLKGNDDLDIRRFLEPMSTLAQDTESTFVCLVHFSAKKGSADTGNLIMGSSAWQQVARSVVAVAQDKDAGTVKAWNSKANLAPRTLTMEAQIVSETVHYDGQPDITSSRVNWLGECAEDGSDLLNPDGDQAADDADEVKMVLLDYLESHGGEAPAGDCLKACRAAGLSDQTVKNRRRKLGVQSRRATGGNGFVWAIDLGTDTTDLGTEVPTPLSDTGTQVPRYLHSSEGVSRYRHDSRYLDTEVPSTRGTGTQPLALVPDNH